MLVSHDPTEELARALVKFLKHESYLVRKEAIYTITQSGFLLTSPHIVEALQDEDEDVATAALGGLNHALENKVISEDVKSQIYSDIAPVLLKTKRYHLGHAPLYNLDPDRAAYYYLSLPYELNAVEEALHLLYNDKLKWDRLKLRELILKLESKSPSSEADTKYVLGNLLKILAHHRFPADEDFFNERTSPDSKRPDTVHYALKALIIFHNLDDLEDEWGPRDVDYATLTKEQKYYISFWHLERITFPFGFHEYFSISYADNWKDAMAGAEAIGAHNMLRVFRDAVARFGPKGPSTDLNKREAELEKLPRKSDAFSDLDASLKRYDDGSSEKMLRYILANKESFKKADN